MKKIYFLTASLLLLSTLAVRAAEPPPPPTDDICKKGDLKDCAAVLKSKISNPQDFASAYEDICVANKTFKCLKIVVRGDVNEEMKYQAQDHPKGHLFNVKLDTEEKIYILEKK